jgi:RimJ/RimL family protein N-acetyltransferase
VEPGHTWVVDVYVETDRLVLRRFTPDDLELVVELDGDPEVKRYIDGGAPVDRQELTETLRWWLGYYDRGQRYGFLGGDREVVRPVHRLVPPTPGRGRRTPRA